MKYQTVLSACLLLLWTLTASVSCEEDEKQKPIQVTAVSDGIKLSCADGLINFPNGTRDKSPTLTYKDANSGEYKCDADSNDRVSKIYVKFRTCDNCVELDEVSIVGMVVGNVVATIVIGVAVYLVASPTRIGPITSHKRSDRQHLVPNEVSNRPTDGHYQPLNVRRGQKSEYDVLHKN